MLRAGRGGSYQDGLEAEVGESLDLLALDNTTMRLSRVFWKESQLNLEGRRGESETRNKHYEDEIKTNPPVEAQ